MWSAYMKKQKPGQQHFRGERWGRRMQVTWEWRAMWRRNVVWERNELERKGGKNRAANSERNFLWCQSWQTERKRNLKETLVFDVKRGEGWWSGREHRRKKKISWEMKDRGREREKNGVFACACRAGWMCQWVRQNPLPVLAVCSLHTKGQLNKVKMSPTYSFYNVYHLHPLHSVRLGVNTKAIRLLSESNNCLIISFVSMIYVW